MLEKPQVTQILDELIEPKNLEKVKTLFQALCETNAQHTVNSHKEEKIKIGMDSLVRDLGSGALNASLQHFFTWNHRFVAMLSEKNRRAAVSTYDFVDSQMPNAIFNANQMQVIESKKELISEINGTFVDLGVYKGSSTRALSRIFSDKVIHGFDSFEGLPEDWSHVLKGAFGDVKGVLPDMPDNVKLYKGWFDDTLPEWKKLNPGPISLLRVDCDIYSSTKTIFNVLGDMVIPGTWIVFDELIGYREWENHEHKAFQEFLGTRPDLSFEYNSFGLTYVLGKVTHSSNSQ